MFRANARFHGLLAAIVLTLMTATATGGFFVRDIVTEIAILGILVIALDLAAGFGGMVSLAHGAIMGVGAYGYALACQAGLPPWPAALAGIIAAAIFGGALGAICTRTEGIFFIMATLAFGQMGWAIAFRSDALGGDNGMGGIPRAPLPFLDSNDPAVFAVQTVVILTVVCLAVAALLGTPFGRALQAVHENPARAAAIGLPPRRIRIIAFAMSSMIAGIAGVLAAQHIQFVSPELMQWTTSGEALVVLILGGIGTLIGPVIGAVVFVGLKHWAAGWTDHWHLILGLLLIAVVLSGKRGIYGAFQVRRRDD